MNAHVNLPRGLVSVRAEGAADAQALKLVQDFTAEFKSFREANDQAIKALEKTAEDKTAEAVTKAEEAVAKVTALAASLTEIEQSVSERLKASAPMPAGSIGQIVVNSAEYKAVAPKPGFSPESGFKLRVEANTITGQTGSPATSDSTLVPADRQPGIVPGAFRSLRIADLLVTVPTVSNSWEFTRENVWTNNAAETAEAAAKPESVLTFEQLSVPVRTIAHFIKASNQILADAPALRAYIDNRLRYGVEYRLDAQLLNGDGAGQNISGMTNSGNYTAFTPATGDTAIDSLNRAKYAIIAADWAPTGIVMNPADWGAIERLKTDDKAYLVGNPFGTIVPTMWGLPVVVSNAMASGKFLMADFTTSYEHISRMSTVVDIGFVNDDFTKNLVTIRAERRDALATIRPASTRYGFLKQ